MLTGANVALMSQVLTAAILILLVKRSKSFKMEELLWHDINAEDHASYLPATISMFLVSHSRQMTDNTA
jgi:hypothetical protein